VTGPAAEPISVAELRQWCAIESDRWDDQLARHITAARQYLTPLCGPLVNETHDVYFAGWPIGDALPMPGDLVSVSAFEWTVAAETTSSWTVSGTNLQLSSVTQAKVETGTPAAIRLVKYKMWPSGVLGSGWPIRVRAVIGRGAAGANVPEPLRHAVAMLAAHLFENREAITDSRAVKVPWGVDRLISEYRHA